MYRPRLLTTHAKAGGHVHTILSANKNVWNQNGGGYGGSGPGTESRCFVAASSRHYGELRGISRFPQETPAFSNPKLMLLGRDYNPASSSQSRGDSGFLKSESRRGHNCREFHRAKRVLVVNDFLSETTRNLQTLQGKR